MGKAAGMTWIVMLLVLVCALVLQMAFPPVAWMGQVRAPFLLAAPLYYALSRQTGATFVSALAAGLLEDAMSQVPLGYSALVFCAAGWIATRLRAFVLTESVPTQAALGGLAAAGATLALYGLLRYAGAASCPAGRLVWKVGSTAALGAVCAPVVFLVASRLDRLAGNAIEESPGPEEEAFDDVR
jgi:rod shape-determining protein MreD